MNDSCQQSPSVLSGSRLTVNHEFSDAENKAREFNIRYMI